jgi:hypothetical protein
MTRGDRVFQVNSQGFELWPELDEAAPAER